MIQGTARRRRVKVSVTVAPELLQAVDAFVRQHPETDRSKVVEDALRGWYAQQQERAMEEQFAGPPLAIELEDRAAWRQIQDAAAARILGRADD